MFLEHLDIRLQRCPLVFCCQLSYVAANDALTLHSTIVVGIRGILVQLVKQIPNDRYCLRVELIDQRRVDGHTHSARTWVYAEWRFQQVIPVLGNLCVDPRIGVLQDDIFERLFVSLLNGLARLSEICELTKSGDPVFFNSPTTDMRSLHRSVLDLSGILCHFDRKGPIASYMSDFLFHSKHGLPLSAGRIDKSASHPFSDRKTS